MSKSAFWVRGMSVDDFGLMDHGHLHIYTISAHAFHMSSVVQASPCIDIFCFMWRTGGEERDRGV